jgi:hypothetical protein
MLSADGKAVDLYEFISLNAGATKALAERVEKLTAENAIQRQQIESHKKEIEELKARTAAIDALKRLVCAQNKKAAVCKQ